MATPKKSSTSSPSRRATSPKATSKPAEAAEDVAPTKAAASTKPRPRAESAATSATPRTTRSRARTKPPLRPERVRERAYLLAESNGFAGDPGFYWRLAERELGSSSQEPS